MTWKVEFELTTPDEMGKAEALLTVLDALIDMVHKEGAGWHVKDARATEAKA